MNLLIEEKIYCGNQTTLPDEYDSFGNLSTCQQKGVGVGKRLQYEQQ